MKVGIIGMGIIGNAVKKMFPKAVCVDKDDDHNILNDCDFVFVCVPTPNNGDGLDMTTVDCVVQEIKGNPVVVICSALQPCTADTLSFKTGLRIVVQPEYFGETVNHPLTDLSMSKFLILGGKSEDVDRVIELYKTVYNANIRIRKVTALEAEVIKLSENRAIMFKVAQCQELYDACKRNKVDYNVIREAVYGDDPRFNLWFTFIYPDKRGCNSKCIPKDVYGWKKWAVDCPLTSGLLEYNESLLNDN